MADRHVAHEEKKSNPGHEWAGFQKLHNNVNSTCADGQCSQPVPHIEEANEVEERGATKVTSAAAQNRST